METWMSDVRYALRVLGRAPAFTAVAALTLALGMGANVAIFTVVDAVMLDPLPWAEPERAVMIWSRWKGFDKTWTNAYESRAYAERCASLRSVALWGTRERNLTGDGEAVRVGTGEVTAATFETFGVPPLLGRTFTSDEDRPEGPRVAVLGYALWQGRYAGDPAVLGRLIAIDGVPHEVVGVMPRGFALPTDFGEEAAEPTALWTPRRVEKEELSPAYGNHGDYAAARLKPGATVARANEELARVADELTAEGAFPKDQHFKAFAVRVSDEIVGPFRPALLLLAGAVGFLMLIACANVANLLLARAEGRQREMAVRSALGAGPGRLVRQLLTEGLVLALIAAALGLAAAHAGLQLLAAGGPLHVPRAVAASVDTRALLFAVLLSMATTLVFALAPALHALRVDLVEPLKEGGRGSGGLARRRWRGGLIVAETAFAVVLAVGAGLMARSLHNLGRIDLGLRPEGVLTASLALPRAGYETPEAVAAFYGELLRGVRALPGVKEAGLLRSLPLGQTIGDWGIRVEGYDHGTGQHGQGDWQVASGGAAEALGERLVRGRFLSDDDTAQAPLVAVINEAMARRYWPGQDPVGRRFRQGGENRPWVTVVGIVGDVRHNGITGPVKAKFYRPHGQFHLSSGNPPRLLNLVVQAEGDPLALTASVRGVVEHLDPDVPVANVRTMEEVVQGSIGAPRFAGRLLVLFAALALTLAAVGVYGVLSYTVSERAPEIGVRMALGARPRDVMRVVLTEAGTLAGAGVGIGVLLALALTRVMQGLLYEVGPADPASFAVAALVLPAVALFAAWLPARRAALVEPATVLRSE